MRSIALALLIATTALAASGCARRGIVVHESSDSVAAATLVGDANAAAGRAVPRGIVRAMYDTAIGTDAAGEPVLAAAEGTAGDWQAIYAFGPRAGSQPAIVCDFRSKSGGTRLGEMMRDLCGREGELLYVEGEFEFATLSPGGGSGRMVAAGVAVRAARKISGDRKRLFLAEDVAAQASRNEVVEFRAVPVGGGEAVRIDGNSIVRSASFDVYEIAEIDVR